MEGYIFYYYEFEFKIFKAFCVAAQWDRVILRMDTEDPHKETGYRPEH
jgi:hypothetical protein